MGLHEQCRRVDLTHHRHWRRVGPRAAVKRNWERWDLAQPLLPFIYSPAVDFINNFFISFVFPICLSSPSNLLRFFFCFFLSDLASPSLFQAAGCVVVFRSMAAQLLVSKSSASAGFAVAARSHWSSCGDGRGCRRRWGGGSTTDRLNEVTGLGWSVGGGVPLAARKNAGQRRGATGWLLEQKSQSRGTVLGNKNRGRRGCRRWVVLGR